MCQGISARISRPKKNQYPLSSVCPKKMPARYIGNCEFETQRAAMQRSSTVRRCNKDVCPRIMTCVGAMLFVMHLPRKGLHRFNFPPNMHCCCDPLCPICSRQWIYQTTVSNASHRILRPRPLATKGSSEQAWLDGKPSRLLLACPHTPLRVGCIALCCELQDPPLQSFLGEVKEKNDCRK